MTTLLKYVVLLLFVTVTFLFIDSKVLRKGESGEEIEKGFLHLDELILEGKLNSDKIQDNIDRLFQQQNQIIAAIQTLNTTNAPVTPANTVPLKNNTKDNPVLVNQEEKNENPVNQEEETLETIRAKIWNERKQNLDWDTLETVKDVKLPTDLVSDILHELTAVIEIPPNIPPKITTRPAQFELPLPAQCSNGILYPKFIKDTPQSQPKKIVDVFQFGYEYDVLEVRLNELNDVVDLFVIGEATCSHRLAEKKLFLASQIDERFYKFRDKIFLVVMDDAICDKMEHLEGSGANSDDWRLERFSRGEVWTRFRQSTIYESYSDALFILGDCDEIPRSELVHQFKYCMTTTNDPIGIGGLFFRNNFEFIEDGNSAVQLSFPYPLITTGDAIDRDISVLRNMPPGNRQVQNAKGGYHLNRFGSNYLRLYKQLAIAEGGGIPRKNLTYLDYPEQLQQFIDQGARECCDQPRSSHIPGGSQRIEFMKHNIPWFALCNHDRFPDLLPETMPLPGSWEDIDSFCRAHTA